MAALVLGVGIRAPYALFKVATSPPPLCFGLPARAVAVGARGARVLNAPSRGDPLTHVGAQLTQPTKTKNDKVSRHNPLSRKDLLNLLNLLNLNRNSQGKNRPPPYWRLFT